MPIRVPRPIRLRPGIAHLAAMVPDVMLVPLAIEYVFWNESPAGIAGAGSGRRSRATATFAHLNGPSVWNRL